MNFLLRDEALEDRSRSGGLPADWDGPVELLSTLFTEAVGSFESNDTRVECARELLVPNRRDRCLEAAAIIASRAERALAAPLPLPGEPCDCDPTLRCDGLVGEKWSILRPEGIRSKAERAWTFTRDGRMATALALDASLCSPYDFTDLCMVEFAVVETSLHDF